MTRTLTSVALALLMITSMVAVPVAAAGGDVGFQQYDRGGANQPSFIVTYDNGSLDSLETWAEERSEYDIVEYTNESNEALVAGPRFQVESPSFWQDPIAAASAGTIAPTPLEDRSYIVDVSPNYRHSYAEPLTSLASESAYDAPASDWAVRGGYSTDGIAFSGDANESTMAEVRTAIDADEVSADGTGVTVTVLDTGLNVKNGSDDPLYGTRISAARNFVSDEDAVATNDYTNVSDGDGHGSWVAASIAANATNDSYDGVAPGANLLVGKTLDDDGSGSTQDIVEGIRWAEANNADILSMSLGSPVYDEEIAAALEDYLAGNGTVAYVAVGNSRFTRPVQIASPADAQHEGVISVAATNTTDAENASVAYFSQTGEDNGYTDASGGETQGAGPDVAMPGMSITVPTYSESGYRRNSTLSGTSMATPIEAARGAVGLDANPSLVNNTETFASWVRNTTNPIPNAGSTEVGNGMGSVKRLVNLNASETTQEEERTDPAKNRDMANGDYSVFRAIIRSVSA